MTDLYDGQFGSIWHFNRSDGGRQLFFVSLGIGNGVLVLHDSSSAMKIGEFIDPFEILDESWIGEAHVEQSGMFECPVTDR